MAHRNITLINFQKRNCPGCPLAYESLVGSGLNCCSCVHGPQVKGDRCITRNGPMMAGIEYGQVKQEVAA